MPFEVTCGQCHGALLVEHAGVVVECPTCGAHLDIPADADLVEVESEHTHVESPNVTSGNASGGVLPSVESDVLQEPDATPGTQQIVSHSSPFLNELAALPASLSVEADNAIAEENSPDAPVDPTGTTDPALPVVPIVDASADPEQTLIAEGSTPPSWTPEPATVVLDDVAATAMAESIAPIAPPAPIISEPVVPRFESPPVAVSTVPPAVATPATEQTVQIEIPPAPPREVVSKQLFFYVASYASALTLVLLYLLYSVFTYRDHVLESLPDIEPPMKDGKIGMKTAKPQDSVPRGHVMRLGESQRFGNLRVTPVKITRGPLTFEHLFGDRNMTRDPSRPVYKLWLTFENVSRDQVFAPLSTPIVYKRYASGLGNYKTNNFLVADTERMKKNADLYYLFGQPENSEFAIAGQKLNTTLAPGEKLETFLPAEDTLDKITGEWTWRVFFRKGYNPSSHRGVTTVIDVHFDGDAIATDGTSAQQS